MLESGNKGRVVGVVLADGSCPAYTFLKDLQLPEFKSRMKVFCERGTLKNPQLMRELTTDKKDPSISEIKVDAGQGWRLYGVRRGSLFVATHGGAKPKPNRVKAEVEKARRIYEEWQR